MFSRVTPRSKSSPVKVGPPSSSLFRVRIHADGSALMEGKPLQVPEGQPVQAAVLDVLHHHAQSLNRSVTAVILDETEGGSIPVEVAPDGSSRVLTDPSDERPSTGTPLPEPVPHTVTVPSPSAPSSGFTDATMSLRLPPADISPGQAADPPHRTAVTAAAVPEELAALVDLTIRSVDAGALERATALAFRLRQHAVRNFGTEHPYALEALSLEAFVAHKSSNHLLSSATWLKLARIRHRRSDPRVRDELVRATAAWQRVGDDIPFALDQGRALSALWEEIAQEQVSSPQDIAMLRQLNTRVRALSDTHVSPTPSDS
ncbi:hypothetical protein [Streptomyces sp. NPDC017991]|uniref:hypothetical protein n=1 Tax=Streptomyces sp. NPDC017991 TaxID=3365026 RepID=UPI0037952E21